MAISLCLVEFKSIATLSESSKLCETDFNIIKLKIPKHAAIMIIIFS